MSREPDQQRDTSPYEEPGVEPDGPASQENEEEIPLGLLITLIVLAIGIAAIYLTVGGGHSHFH